MRSVEKERERERRVGENSEISDKVYNLAQRSTADGGVRTERGERHAAAAPLVVKDYLDERTQTGVASHAEKNEGKEDEESFSSFPPFDRDDA